MLGILALAYAAAAYVMFWRALKRLEPKSRLPLWIKLAGVFTALLFGPAIFLYMLIRALINPRYWPTDVVFIEIEYNPVTGQLTQEDEYMMRWQSQADLDAKSRVLVH